MICECGHTIFAHRAETWREAVWRFVTLRFRACCYCACNVFVEGEWR